MRLPVLEVRGDQLPTEIGKLVLVFLKGLVSGLVGLGARRVIEVSTDRRHTIGLRPKPFFLRDVENLKKPVWSGEALEIALREEVIFRFLSFCGTRLIIFIFPFYSPIDL
jgi:hypothetical protein